MKRVFLLAALGLISLSLALAGQAWAAPKPPKRACLLWGTVGASVLLIKSFGKVVTSAGKTKIYALYGEFVDIGGGSRPLSGSGHMNGNIFHFGFTAASVAGFAGLPAFTFEGHYDVQLQTGTGEFSYYGGGIAGAQSPTLAITPVDCAGGALPYGTESGGMPHWFAPGKPDSEK